MWFFSRWNSPKRSYDLEKFTFGTTSEGNRVSGFRSRFPNGSSAYQLFVPDADYFYTVAVLNFGAINEGSLPLDTAHRWEHAVVVEQGYLKQLSRIRASGGAYTDAHKIGITARSKKQKAVVPSTGLLCDTFVNADKNLDITDNERDAISVECLEHYSNPKDSFTGSLLVPSTFSGTPLERIALPYEEMPPTDIQFIRDFHITNFSPHRVTIVTAGPFDKSYPQTDEIFTTIAGSLGKMERRPVVETHFDIPLDAEQLQFDEIRPDYRSAYVGLGFRVSRNPKEIAALELYDCIMEDENEGSRRLIDLTREKRGGFYHPHVLLMDLGYAATYVIYGATLPRKYAFAVDVLKEVIADRNIDPEDFNAGKDFAVERIDDMLSDSEDTAEAVADRVHFPYIGNDPDKLREELLRTTLDDVISVVDKRLNPDKGTVAVARPVETLKQAA